MSLELCAEKGCAVWGSISDFRLKICNLKSSIFNLQSESCQVPQVRVCSLDANLGLGIFALARKLPSFARPGRRGHLPLRALSLLCRP